MNLEQIREKVRLGQWRISKHAVVEAAKDGLSPRHIKEIILTGKIIESYPERERHLIYGLALERSEGMLPDGIPVHVVIDYSNPEQMVAVTAYIPTEEEWIAFQRRKR